MFPIKTGVFYITERMPGQNLNKNVGSPHKKHQHFLLLPRGFFDKGYVQRQQVGVDGVVH